MFAEYLNYRKRGRDDEEDTGPSGFSEHRSKRRIAALPVRQSPNLARPLSPPFIFNTNYTSEPAAPPTITPADSDAEDKPASNEPRSFFSPYSSSPACTVTQSGPTSPLGSQLTRNSDVTMFSDDMEMADTVHLSPGTFHNDPSVSIAGRIPTPIHSSFAPYIRSEKASIHDVDFADDEAVVGKFKRGRRLPSPISEGEMSPSIIVDGIGDMQMEMGNSPHPERETPAKKGHTRSKHSLRTWTGSGFGSEMNANPGMKRSFSMGYRADCEKCRMKVPGHFSHIITY
ncbi:hypothetical protein BJ875DRAFT_30981 [Amylocarpus encephaloides]|uniref:Uncharacterized protein n=1 Tax=Amylocarpus encephaloides TaxID=45428 RepID=A0A9P7YHZ3_9HELO|nr:hypothetical protein BJ875DRAFT_30981 [Amylocarpus encephaloides]